MFPFSFPILFNLLYFLVPSGCKHQRGRLGIGGPQPWGAGRESSDTAGRWALKAPAHERDEGCLQKKVRGTRRMESMTKGWGKIGDIKANNARKEVRDYKG